MATALRAAGFLPLPRLWVKVSDMPKIHAITNKYRDEVIAVRQQVNDSLGITHVPGGHSGSHFGSQKDQPDPALNKEAAWAAFERHARV